MTATENNVAAQAGDELRCPFCDGEPRHLRKLEGIYVEALICDACNFGLAPEKWRQRAAQVSPRATADVERDAARYRWLRERPYSDWKRIAFNTMDDHPFAIRCRDEEIDAAIATTKPGA